MKITQRNGKAAFTLIELMAVITIIVILAGLVVGGMGFVTERQAKEKARVQIALLSKAIEEYKLDMGKYPGSAENTSATGTISAELYDRLFYQGYEFGETPGRPDTPTDPKATKIYLPDLDPTSSKQGWVTAETSASAKPKPAQKILDPWGNEYLYRKGTNAVNPDFDLWSKGKDGLTKTGTAAGDMTSKEMRDDIKNF
jgi:prepilin-type N-terminal cleavage/methylation domain-containing protein